MNILVSYLDKPFHGIVVEEYWEIINHLYKAKKEIIDIGSISIEMLVQNFVCHHVYAWDFKFLYLVTILFIEIYNLRKSHLTSTNNN